MKKSKLIKIFSMLILALMIILVLCQTVNAWEPEWDKAEGQNPANTTNAVYSVLGSVISIVSIVGAGIAIIILIVLGIQYITASTGFAKAEIKKQAPNYILGAVIIFAASAILKIIQMFVEGNINNI